MDLSRLIEEAVNNALKHSGYNTGPVAQAAPVQSACSATCTTGSFGSGLFVFCGAHGVNIQELVQKLNMCNSATKYVAMTKSFEKIYGRNVFSGISGVTFLNDQDYYSVLDIINKVDLVEIPVLSLNTASKIVGLISDNLVCNLILTALFMGKTVNSTNAYLLPPQATPGQGLNNEVSGLLNKLRSFGLNLNGVSAETSYSAPTSYPPAVPYQNSCSLDSADCLACGQCVAKRPVDVKDLVDSGVVRVGASAPALEIPAELAKYIDHTLLKPESTEEQIIEICKDAREYSFASVCVNPGYVKLAAELLKGCPVKVCTVIGFPLGATTTETKVFETENAIRKGADEIDMVINVGLLKSRNYMAVERDIRCVADMCIKYGKILKVILETSLLSDEEKVMACSLAKSAGAHYVKTATGFGPGGATKDDIELMRKTVGENIGVKASGGIRDTAKAFEMIKAGATRIGASASIAIVKGEDAGAGKY